MKLYIQYEWSQNLEDNLGVFCCVCDKFGKTKYEQNQKNVVKYSKVKKYYWRGYNG